MTKAQQTIMELLFDYHCLRTTHIEKLIKAQYHVGPEKVGQMLNQLRNMRKVVLKSDFVSLPNCELDKAVIDAFDLLIDITNGIVEQVSCRASPFALYFTIFEDDIEKRFGIMVVGSCSDNQIKRNIRILKNKDITIILVIKSKEQRDCFLEVSNCFFALSDNQGHYRYFNSGNKPS